MIQIWIIRNEFAGMNYPGMNPPSTLERSLRTLLRSLVIKLLIDNIFIERLGFRFESRRKRFCEKSSARLQSPKTNFCKITFVAWFQLVLGFFYWIETAKANTESQLGHNGKKPKTQSVSWITVSPCLMRLLILGKIRISQMFGLCDLPNANFRLFISLVQFFG